MSNVFDNVDIQFASSISCKTMPRWQRKAMQAQNSSTSRMTPRKDRVRGDRFIPDRSAMNMEASHYKMLSGADDENTQQDAAGMPGSSKILAFKQKAPKPKEGFQSDLRVMYTQSRAAAKPKKTARFIPQAPERILDAPDLLANFYVNPLDWSNENMLCVALNDTAYLWNASNGSITELCHLENAGDYIASVSWAQDGAHLAVGTNSGVVQIWDVTKQKQVRDMSGHGARVGALDWNNHILSSGSQRGIILNSDVRVRDHVMQALENHAGEVCGLKWSPNGRMLASGGNDNLVNIWSDAGEVRHTLTHHQAGVKALAWCPWTHNLLATGGGTADGTIRFWNSTTGNCTGTIDTKSQITSLLWSKEYQEIIAGHGHNHNGLSIWKYPSLDQVAELKGHTDRVVAMAMSPDGEMVVSASGDESLRFWKCFQSDPKRKARKMSANPNSRLSSTIR
ncbi:Cdc20 [Salpingoeca rosetta]|uniref:Cdc20 n=1 Tax=Salpingoeca rosetta (strain ATCC 50818 / BSB-021) TaxID=946362 RepID=F2TXX8_SALR5|nr:Cdc20 [Salpingoeca rosetta]EGD76237.1 Cdc20 [Salpingoeca rosetta]|eukprot:XP_004998412.1 Cdc20 [Salpingoeca rosetta]